MTEGWKWGDMSPSIFFLPLISFLHLPLVKANQVPEGKGFLMIRFIEENLTEYRAGQRIGEDEFERQKSGLIFCLDGRKSIRSTSQR